MNKEKATKIGGFVGLNTGTITECYSLLHIKSKNATAGGFVGKNSNTITECFVHAPLKGITGGFAGVAGGDQNNHCYFFHNIKEKKLKKWHDWMMGQGLKELSDKDAVKALGFGNEEVWEFQENKGTPILFDNEKWMYHCDTTEDEKEQPELIVIENADQLFEFAKMVNKGSKGAVQAKVILTCDIDLGGKEWVPIGKERTCAFTGTFNGMGHTVKNFVITNKNLKNKGFFCFLKGFVYNLTVDCSIKKGDCLGGIAAQCEGGVIICCGAIVEINGKKGILGGLVGINSGTISRSYAAGVIKGGFIPLIFWLPLILVPVIVCLFIYRSGQDDNISIFAPVPYDPDQVIDKADEMMPNTEGNFVSFQFEQKIDVKLETGVCAFNFKNPGNSNHNIVVQLQFTDAQATRIMGSTGRTKEEQQKLEALKSYDPETYRMVIAESGAIRPGYKLENLKLVTQDDGAVIPPGDYNAVVYLLFYDIETNERAMLESQLPVVISVQ